MDWDGLRERTLGDVANTLVTEGIGVGAGFIGANTIGRRIEDFLLPAKVDTTSWTSILKGWTYNNVPKLLAWYVIRRYTPETPTTRTQEILLDAKKAVAGSVVFDTLLRSANHGKPVQDPSAWKLLGGKGEEVQTSAPQADIQRLIQENSALRTELNKALQRLATQSISAPPQQVQVQAPQQPQSAPVTAAPVVQAPIVRYQPVTYQPVQQAQPQVAAPVVRADTTPVIRVEQQQPVPPAISERERRFAFMPTYNAPPAVQEREAKFGFAGKSSEKDIATMFGML